MVELLVVRAAVLSGSKTGNWSHSRPLSTVSCTLHTGNLFALKDIEVPGMEQCLVFSMLGASAWWLATDLS